MIREDQSVRCIFDYRYVNSFTLPGDLEPADIVSVIQRMGQAKYITTFNGKSSYSTSPVKPEHQWLMVFVDGNDALWEWTIGHACLSACETHINVHSYAAEVLYPIR